MTFPTGEMGLDPPLFPQFRGFRDRGAAPGAVSSHVGEKWGLSIPGPVGLEESELGGVLLVGCGGPRSESQRAAHPARDLQATTHE